MSLLVETRTFNCADVVVEGWYWAMRSTELRRGKAKPHHFLGRELVLYRGEDLRVIAMDAYCPHMGAHLAEGTVEGNSIRCLFHRWRFTSEGSCEEIPCQKSTAAVAPVRTWSTEEKYGLIWIWAGTTSPSHSVPEVPELKGIETESRLTHSFVKPCHPSVMMINAIDAQHFNSVHNLPVALEMVPEVISDRCIYFGNATQLPKTNPVTRFLSRFYSGPLTYILCYWFGSTGSVTVGPDFQHFHIIFALRPTRDGRSEGQTILVTRRRSGIVGRAYAKVLLFLTGIVGNYFAKGDTVIFKTIRFQFRTPIKADYPIIRFIQHVEEQSTLPWGLQPAAPLEKPFVTTRPPLGGQRAESSAYDA